MGVASCLRPQYLPLGQHALQQRLHAQLPPLARHGGPMIRGRCANKDRGWKAVYQQRQSDERVFSRLKGGRSLNHIAVQGRRKVTAQCYLSLIVLQATLFSTTDMRIEKA